MVVMAEQETTQQEHSETLKNSVEAEASDDLSPMTDAEHETLADLEAKISDCWWKMGQAFAEIKSKKLYRQTKNGTRRTWEEYCKDLHSRTKQQVDKYIRAADVRQILETETNVSVLPATMSQAVELSGLEPAEMVTVIEEAVNIAASENRNPTANDYKQAAAPRRKPKNNKKGEPPAEKPKNNQEKKPPAKKSIAAKSRVVFNINTATLVAPIRKMLEDCQLKATATKNAKGTSFVCGATEEATQALLKSLMVLLKTNGPVDLSITLE